jgi:hypothetical protein
LEKTKKTRKQKNGKITHSIGLSHRLGDLLQRLAGVQEGAEVVVVYKGLVPDFLDI